MDIEDLVPGSPAFHEFFDEFVGTMRLYGVTIDNMENDPPTIYLTIPENPQNFGFLERDKFKDGKGLAVNIQRVFDEISYGERMIFIKYKLTR